MKASRNQILRRLRKDVNFMKQKTEEAPTNAELDKKKKMKMKENDGF